MSQYNFLMKAVGNFESRESFWEALNGNGKLRIGSGATFDTIKREENYDIVLGMCKEHINNALVNDAVVIRDNFNFYTTNNVDNNVLITFITLDEASEKFGIDIEVFSKKEAGQELEHVLIKNGHRIAEEIINIDSSEEADFLI